MVLLHTFETLIAAKGAFPNSLLAFLQWMCNKPVATVHYLLANVRGKLLELLITPGAKFPCTLLSVGATHWVVSSCTENALCFTNCTTYALWIMLCTKRRYSNTYWMLTNMKKMCRLLGEQWRHVRESRRFSETETYTFELLLHGVDSEIRRKQEWNNNAKIVLWMFSSSNVVNQMEDGARMYRIR